MENIIVKLDSHKYEVDSDRTVERYDKLITDFLSSELFALNPYDVAESELDDLLDRRTGGGFGESWIEYASGFYSKYYLKEVVHVRSDIFPEWDDIHFSPELNISMNRFRYGGNVYLENTKKKLPIVKKYEVLGSHGNTTQLHYFNRNIGRAFVFCYQFCVKDDYNDDRFCLRFAEDSYKREALLLTQYFLIHFLIKHPLDCFPHPYEAGTEYRISEINAMATLLNPVIEENKETMYQFLNRFKGDLIAHRLHAESF